MLVAKYFSMALLLLAWPGFNNAQGLAQEQEFGQRQVDFISDVLPLLRERCFECHAGDQIQGDLALDSESGIARGGHSGNAIIAATPEQSELYLRVVSDSEGYRMPKDGPALSAEEVAIFESWIQQGAPWDRATPRLLGGGTRQNAGSIDQLGDVWNWVAESSELPSYRYAGFALASLLLALIIGYGIRRWRPRSHQSDEQPFWKTWSTTLAVGAIFVLAMFQWGRAEQLAEDNRLLEQKIADLDPGPEPPVIISRSNLVVPPYPMHPKRLGGTYYRGNDERSDKLFNGGFYRTATIHLHLTDREGNRKSWGDSLDPKEAMIELTVERAPLATVQLFSQRVLNSTYLRHYSETNADFDERILFRETELEQTWTARIPIEHWDQQGSQGKVYLFYGTMAFGEQTGRPHFGIVYDFQLDDGNITDQSQLWMGSIYNLNGRVLVPEKGKLLLDRWFDFRPIPEIEGTPPDDPELLGLPEHIQAK